MVWILHQTKCLEKGGAKAPFLSVSASASARGKRPTGPRNRWIVDSNAQVYTGRMLKSGSRCRHIGIVIVFLLTFFCTPALADKHSGKTTQVIHVIVALCDNVHQGIVPVPKILGNGDAPRTNLYWGAAYGLKTVFKRNKAWELESSVPKNSGPLLERCTFRHRDTGTILIADAWRGSEIRQATRSFLRESGGASFMWDKRTIIPNLVIYVGHNGLMDFDLDVHLLSENPSRIPVMVFCCSSRLFFHEKLETVGAWPLLLTTGLMAPEGYVVEAAVDGWIAGEHGAALRDHVAATYNKYQKCGIKGARRLFTTEKQGSVQH